MKKISFQKIFCFVSILFIGGCCIFYGTRFLKLYLANRKEEIVEKNTLAKNIKDSNNKNDSFKFINNQYYFTNKEDNNYLLYSNIVWRIIKINEDNSITAISDSAVTSLAYGSNLDYSNSYINKWLNTSSEDYSGILETALNEPNKYLQKTEVCTNTIDEATNNPCEKINEDNYISLLNIYDYLNAGSKDSYIKNDEYFYLGNTNSNSQVWYVDTSGKLSLDNGTEIIGVRPVITIKANTELVSGKGTKKDPYTIESSVGLYGSYVSLDSSLWRIYEVNENEVKLMLNDYIKSNNENLTYSYSSVNSYFNDYQSGSAAYYINHTLLNTLSYKDKIKETKWANGYYNSSSKYDYEYALNNTIDSKVALMSIGNIFYNPDLSNFITMTGSNNRGSMIYTIDSSKKANLTSISQEMNVVPTISLDFSLLTKGNGTSDSPYEME